MRAMGQAPKKKRKQRTVKVVSLFSGALGLDLGLEKAGFRIVVAVECDPVAVATIRLNRPRLPVIAKRIEDVTTAEIRKVAKLRRGDRIIVVGGPSCQAFSTAGQRRSLEDPRGNMFRQFVRVVRELRPNFFVMENVRGLLSAAAKHRPLALRGPGNPKLALNEELGSAFRRVTSAFKQLDYYVAFDLLNAADYGVPQTRERLVFIGSRSGERISFPVRTHGKEVEGLKPWKTLRSAVFRMKRTKHEFKEFHERKIQLLRRVPEGKNWLALPKRMRAKAIGGAYASWGGRTGFLRRLAWNRPSPALVTVPDGNATCLCHPTRSRPLSVQEYARIQQVPAAWRFCGSTNQKYRQIGNAVPVGLGYVIGQAIKQALRQKPRYRARGIVECANVDLVQRLSRTKRTYVNPPHMRRYKKAATLTRWLTGRSRARKDIEVFAAAEVRRILDRISANAAGSRRESAIVD
jgi:DNA (cytosine-5)-methyltransferase 1